MWASLLSLVMKRRVAQTLMGDGLSTLKAAKNSGTWWFPLLEAVAHRVLVEIRERLEWAAVCWRKMPVEPSSENRYRTGP